MKSVNTLSIGVGSHGEVEDFRDLEEQIFRGLEEQALRWSDGR